PSKTNTDSDRSVDPDLRAITVFFASTATPERGGLPYLDASTPCCPPRTGSPPPAWSATWALCRPPNPRRSWPESPTEDEQAMHGPSLQRSVWFDMPCHGDELLARPRRSAAAEDKGL